MEGRIKDTNIVVFDTETTGLAVDSYVVEIGAVKLRDGRVIDTFSRLIRPPIPIPSDVVRVHGIDNEKVKNAPVFVEVVDKFLEFIDGAVLVAHNAPFDMKILTSNILRTGRRLPDNPVLDTCKALKNLFPNMPSYSLRYLARHFGSPYGGFHRALSDAEHTAYVFLHTMNKCGVDSESPVEELMKLFGPPLFFHQYRHIFKLQEPSDLKGHIIRAIERGYCLDLYLRCADPEVGVLKRRVAPLNLFTSRGRWYLRAMCIAENRERVFRLDLITKIKVVELCVS